MTSNAVCELPQDDICTGTQDSIFDRCSWFYALCRERLFADHTHSIAARFRMSDPAAQPRVLLEAGCGPGFYSVRFAQLFPELEVVGLDPSQRLLEMARAKAQRLNLHNCRFVRAQAQHLADFPAAVDFIIASRLFLILPNRRPVLEAMHASLRPSGLLFIAEPVSPLRAIIPITVMRALHPLSRYQRTMDQKSGYSVLTRSDFNGFIHSFPWKRVEHWSDRAYQYALCEKAL